MARLPDAELVRLVTEVRPFPDPETAIAVILGESGGDPTAVNRQPDNVDRGLWQISSKWHPETSDAAAFDPEASTRKAFVLSNSGTDFNPWHATKSPRFPAMRAEAQRILEANPPTGDGRRSPGLLDIAKQVPGVGGLVDTGSDAVGAVAGGLAGAAEVLGFLGKALAVLVSVDFWKRVGYAAAGLVLLYLGLAAIFGRQALGLGITAASKGMVDGDELVADDDDPDE